MVRTRNCPARQPPGNSSLQSGSKRRRRQLSRRRRSSNAVYAPACAVDENHPRQIFATGGASDNPVILQVMADVMNCPVLRVQASKSAALGAALSATHGWLAVNGKSANWQKVIAGFTAPIAASKITPNKKAARIYDRLLETYAQCERTAQRA